MAEQIQYGGLHHLALVCSDMERTVDFYTNVHGMKLKKGFDLDRGYGQHFFFDMGGGNELALLADAQHHDAVDHHARAPAGGHAGVCSVDSRPALADSSPPRGSCHDGNDTGQAAGRRRA